MREQKRHDHIIAISQSELMLVVALVFLLLAFFAGAPAHRESAEEGQEGDAEQEEQLAEEGETDAAAEEADPDEEVDETLSDEGEEQEGEGVDMVLVEEKTGSNHDFPHQEVSDEEIVRELVLALEERGLLEDAGEEEDDGQRKELALQEVGKALERLGELEDLEADVDRILSDAGIGAQEDRPSAMRELSEKLEEYRADEIGFTPCWRGDGSPAYYKAFDITYDPGSDTFLIAQHSDLGSANATVRRDVRSRLPALHDHPTGRASRAEMVDYARRLNAEKVRAHGTECKLATTIDEESRGRTVKFINNELNLFTVYR